MRNYGSTNRDRRFRSGSYSSEMRRQGLNGALGMKGTKGIIDKIKEDSYNRFMQAVDEYMNTPKPRNRNYK